jgi:hypothetical protein
VRPPRLRAAPQDPREVGDVEGDQNAALAGGEVEDSLVVQSLERGLLVWRADVVSAFAQPGAHDAAGDVRVEQYAHVSLGLDAQERIELA